MSKEHHYCDNKYEKSIADKLSALDRKIHYKLYMLWASNPTLTRSNIADAMGVSRQAFTKYIREETPLVPDIYKLFRLSKQFEIPLHYFTDDDVKCMDNPQRMCYSRQLYRGCKQGIDTFSDQFPVRYRA